MAAMQGMGALPGGGGFLNPAAAAAAAGGALPTGIMIKGTVKAWYEDKGFGFITSEEGSVDVFVHRSTLTDGLMLVQGSQIMFEAVWKIEKGKYAAENVVGAVPGGPGKGCGGGAMTGASASGKGAAPPAGPSDNLFVAGLPLEISEERTMQIFGQYGVITQLKLLPDSGKPDRAALIRMNDVAQAQWIVENLNGNIPLGLTAQVSCRYADNRAETAKALGLPKGSSIGGFGKASGKGAPDGRFAPYSATPTVGVGDASHGAAVSQAALATALVQLSSGLGAATAAGQQQLPSLQLLRQLGTTEAVATDQQELQQQQQQHELPSSATAEQLASAQLLQQLVGARTPQQFDSGAGLASVQLLQQIQSLRSI